MLTGSVILCSCKRLVVICMTTARCRSGTTASVDSAKPGSVLAAVEMLCFYQKKQDGLLQPAQNSV